MNVAVGGHSFLGNPDAKTAFPGDMLRDYVLVSDRSRLRQLPPRGAGKLCPFR